MIRLVKTIAVVLLLFITQNVCVAAWWDTNWNRKVAVQVTNGSGSAQTNYVVRIPLTSTNPPNFDWSNNGDDIRVLDTDESTQLSFFIDGFNSTAETALLWVTIPSLSIGEVRTIYIYYFNNAATSAADASAVFTVPGIKFHTRRSALNPSSRAQAEAEFFSLPDTVPGYGCTIQNSFTLINNQNTVAGGLNNTIFYFSEMVFEVEAADAGNWQFRMGGDFGRGGDFYIDEQTLEEDWVNDMWWNFNWNVASEVLEGTVNLSAGFHSLRALGSEGCCDGPQSIEFRRPTGPWRELSTANLNMNTQACPVENIDAVFSTAQSLADISISKDDGSGTYTPGSSATYTITVVNNGLVDVANLVVADTLPSGVSVNGTWTCDPSVAPGDNTASCITGMPAGTTASGSGNINQNIDLPAGKSLVFTLPVNFSANMADY